MSVVDAAINRVAARGDRQATAAEVVERLVDARLELELRIRAPWLTSIDRAEIIAESRPSSVPVAVAVNDDSAEHEPRS